MDKNVTVINPLGKSIRVSEHMVGDMLKMGCTLKVPQRKDAPEELLRPIKLPPAKVITPEPTKQPLPPMESSVGEQGWPIKIGETEPGVIGFVKPDAPVNQLTNEPVKPKRKSPVRSKSTK